MFDKLLVKEDFVAKVRIVHNFNTIVFYRIVNDPHCAYKVNFQKIHFYYFFEFTGNLRVHRSKMLEQRNRFNKHLMVFYTSVTFKIYC